MSRAKQIAEESAFPIFSGAGNTSAHQSGLTKREYIAAMVMPKMALAVKAAAGTTEEAALVILKAAARASVAAADALLEELAK